MGRKKKEKYIPHIKGAEKRQIGLYHCHCCGGKWSVEYSPKRKAYICSGCLKCFHIEVIAKRFDLTEEQLEEFANQRIEQERSQYV